MSSDQFYQQEHRSFSFGGSVTWAVQRIILFNVVVFALQLVVDMFSPPTFEYLGSVFAAESPGLIAVEYLAFHPQNFLSGWVWTPFTYMLLHGNLMHLFTNMLMLYFFGPTVERVIGTRQFIRFYVVCGALGGLGELLRFMVVPMSPASVVGASGAIMGVLVAFAVIDPKREVYLIPLPVPIHARALVIFILVMNVVPALLNANSGTSWATHLGGMAVGFAYMKMVFYLNSRESRPRKKPYKGEKADLDGLGEAIDNIFEFEKKRKRRR